MAAIEVIFIHPYKALLEIKVLKTYSKLLLGAFLNSKLRGLQCIV
jgi:hypothetical protein